MKNSKIKICYIANTDMAVKFFLINQLNFFKNNDYEVYVVCSSGKFIKDFRAEGIEVKVINFKRRISPIFDLITFLKLFFYFKKEKFDIVHTHTLKPGLLGQLSAKLAGIPIIINTIFGFYFHEKMPYFKKRFFILIEKIAAKCSDSIFFRNREDFQTTIKEKISKPNLIKYFGDGIDIFRFNPKRFSEEFIQKKKKKLSINYQKKVIGIVARLVEEKGYLDFFEALKKVLKRFPDAVILIVGSDDPEKKDALNINIVKNYGIEKNILFLGERMDIDEIYPLMDVFVLPSYREGFPHSIMEASAMEKPVVATNIRGSREAVEDGKTGILVPVKNPEKLFQAMIYFLENSEIAKIFGENGRKKAEKEFDERLLFDRIKKEYQRLIKEKLK